MYDKTFGKIIDRREMLRVKVKSLADEARIIRREEQRTRGDLRWELSHHRRTVVRHAARCSGIAYGLIRGLTLEQMEPYSVSPPWWPEVLRMIRKYGPRDFNFSAVPGLEKAIADEADQLARKRRQEEASQRSSQELYRKAREYDAMQLKAAA